jgi:stage II sporulation protein AA (anti-sigma F factor antagonist)
MAAEPRVTKLGDAVVIELDGVIDGKASADLEKTIAKHVTADVRFVVADFGRVSLLTSAGIRVLLLLRKRLSSARGGLILCAVSERVCTLLEISGLLGQFHLAATRDAALADLATLRDGVPEPPPPTSRIGTVLFALLNGQEVPVPGPAPAPNAPAVEALVSRLRDVLGSDSSESPSPSRKR